MLYNSPNLRKICLPSFSVPFKTQLLQHSQVRRSSYPIFPNTFRGCILCWMAVQEKHGNLTRRGQTSSFSLEGIWMKPPLEKALEVV